MRLNCIPACACTHACVNMRVFIADDTETVQVRMRYIMLRARDSAHLTGLNMICDGMRYCNGMAAPCLGD